MKLKIIVLLALVSMLSLTMQAGKKEKPLMKDFMGLNGHSKLRPKLYAPLFDYIRNYHNLCWDIKKLGDQPDFPQCINQFNWERQYGSWKKHGFTTSLCLMFGPFGRGKEKLWVGKEDWCRDYGKKMAEYFGPTKGKAYVSSIEIGNEPGMEFDNKTYQMIFKNLAQGIREGDPKLKIVTCTATAKEADKWSKNLDETFKDMIDLVDVLNLHTYAQMVREKGKCPWDRSYPEDPAISYLDDVDKVIAWRDQNAIGKEVWITEFGYDCASEKAMKKRKKWFAKLDWQGVTQLQQAQYLIRSFMAFAKRDVDRAYLYYYNDKDQAQVHAAAGLTSNFVPKKAFWAVKQLYYILGNYRFNKIIKEEKDQLFVYEFTHNKEPENVIWVAWSPTGATTRNKDTYQSKQTDAVLSQLPADPVKVLGMAVAENQTPELAWKKNGKRRIELTVGESPVYILMGKAKLAAK